MSELFARLKVEYWYHALLLIGAAGIIAALTIDIRAMSNKQALALFGGVFLVGLGEWINHPLQEAIVPPNMYMRGGGKISGHPRSAKPLGLFFDALGVLLIVGAIARIVWTA